MRQTYEGEIECVIVDDCGTDDSMAIVERMIAAYKGNIKFMIIHHQHNRGLSAARNTGTAAATGDYIYYLDGDDEITPDCLKKMMNVVSKDPDIEIVQGRYRRTGQKEPIPAIRNIRMTQTSTNRDVRRIFFEERQFVVSAWNKLIKRSFVLRFGLQFKEGLLWEDTLWMFNILKHVKNVYFISDMTYLYKYRKDSIVNSTDLKTFAMHKAVFYHDVLMNLTLHDECSELNYVLNDGFPKHYVRFNRILPEYRELFPLLWQKAKEYRAYGLNARLFFYSILGKTKFGWMFFPIRDILRHPACVLYDFKKLKYCS